MSSKSAIIKTFASESTIAMQYRMVLWTLFRTTTTIQGVDSDEAPILTICDLQIKHKCTVIALYIVFSTTTAMI